MPIVFRVVSDEDIYNGLARRREEEVRGGAEARIQVADAGAATASR